MPPATRDYSPLDRLLMRTQAGLSRLAPAAPSSPVQHPGAQAAEAPLDNTQRQHVAGLMRVNHAGEIAAQALYHGQAMVTRSSGLREHLLKAAQEEKAHLDWCAARLHELGEHPSRLAPFWYAGSFAIGAAAGLSGDRTSLGFVEETERQVVEHLDEHLGKLPVEDQRSRAILETMRADEARHGRDAQEAGARRLPAVVRGLMSLTARLMKFGAYRF
jgi:ubiquinone biosynthesis monooxygenase Coq7